MITYRPFRNIDPPLLMDVWNEAFTGRGAVRLRSPNSLDRFVFAKPYFDPNGLILAFEDHRCIGFAHAALLPERSTRQGTVCMIGVRPTHRRRGVGTELLRHCENYLRQLQCQDFFAGASGCNSPFYLGLYGGSSSPGFLSSDQLAEPFFIRHHYQVAFRTLVFQIDLSQPIKTVDPRFAYLRQRYNIRARTPKVLGSYASECSLGQVEPLEFFLDDKSTGELVARTYAWEMEGFSWRWGHPSLGIVNMEVAAPLQRQGLGKFLLLHLLKHFQDQYFEIAEIQVPQEHPLGQHFLQALGFKVVDTGQIFQKKEPG